MATLQYVGARYVPVFYNNPDGSWDWESGVSYEPLTMVKYGTNTYTSKSQVPSTVGSPNENPQYWAQTGNYNGAIIEISGKVDKLYKQLMVNVKNFGAIGDGITDDTIAIQSAVNSAIAENGILYFPAGTYMIGNTINISHGFNSLRIQGENASATILKSTSSIPIIKLIGGSGSICEAT